MNAESIRHLHFKLYNNIKKVFDVCWFLDGDRSIGQNLCSTNAESLLNADVCTLIKKTETHVLVKLEHQYSFTAANEKRTE